MLRQGPIPAFVHGVLEYAAAALFIVAPFIFSFDSSTAEAVSIAVGVGLLIFTGFSALPTGLSKSIPVPAHAVLDYVWGILFVAMPFIGGFSDETAPTAFFIAMGVFWIVLAIATYYEPKPRSPAADRPSRRERRRMRGQKSPEPEAIDAPPEFDFQVQRREPEPPDDPPRR